MRSPLLIDGKRTVYYVSPTPAKDGHYYARIVIEDEPFQHLTDYDWGTDRKDAERIAHDLNKRNGYSATDALDVVASSIAAHNRQRRMGVRPN